MKHLTKCGWWLAVGLMVALSAPAGETAFEGQTIGALAVSSNAKNTIVAVAFKELSPDEGQEITAAHLVSTKNLTDGDTLHVYQKGDGSYKIWTVADGQWVSPAAKFSLGADGNATSEPGTDPLTVPAGFGTGFWLIRSDVSKPFYIYGAAVDVASTEATAGAVNLMGNPLRKSAVATIDGAVAGDTIQIPTSTGLPKVYSCKNVGGKLQWTWWKDSEGKSGDNPPAIAAGVGFWYTSKASAGNVTFSWQ